MKTTTFLLLLVLTMQLVAQGASPQKKPKSDPCPDALSQPEMTECAHKEYRTADATLNKVYANLVSILDAEEKSQLKEVQLIWIKFRDANCNFVADRFKGGTMRPMVFAFCLAHMTSQRTDDLRTQIDERNQ